MSLPANNAHRFICVLLPVCVCEWVYVCLCDQGYAPTLVPYALTHTWLCLCAYLPVYTQVPSRQLFMEQGILQRLQEDTLRDRRLPRGLRGCVRLPSLSVTACRALSGPVSSTGTGTTL